MNIELLETTFASLKTNSPDFALLFYNNIFDRYPTLKILLARIDIQEHSQKFANFLTLIIAHIRDLERVKKIVQKLDFRYIKERIDADYYSAVEEVLLQTLEVCLESEWSDRVEQTWREAYQIVVKLIQETTEDGYSIWRHKSKHQELSAKINQLRIEAITRKALQTSSSKKSIIEMLLNDPYFQTAEQKIGKEKTLQLISELMTQASQKELSPTKAANKQNIFYCSLLERWVTRSPRGKIFN